MLIMILGVFAFPFIITFLSWIIDEIDRYITGPIIKRINDEPEIDSSENNVNIINLTIIENDSNGYSRKAEDLD